jgi:ankyrin repeat protein
LIDAGFFYPLMRMNGKVIMNSSVKKLFVVLLLLILTACASSNDTSLRKKDKSNLALHKKDEKSLLVQAIEEKHDIAASFLASISAEINTKDADGRTPLMKAVIHDQKAVVKVLVSRGADVNAHDNNGYTAMRLAVAGEHYEIAQFLWDSVADKHKALMTAIEQGHSEVIKFLIEKGTDADTNGVLLVKALKNQNSAIADLLLEKNANVNAQDEDGDSALMVAVSLGYPKTVRYLLAKGADVNHKNRSNVTALMESVRSQFLYFLNNRLEIVQALLDAGADISIKDGAYGETALMMAVENGNFDIVNLLLAKGADKREITNNYHIFSAAIGNGKLKEAIDLGADINIRSENGYTALMDFAARGSDEIVDSLLAFGADVNVRDKDGLTPLMLAARYGYISIVEEPPPPPSYDDNVKTIKALLAHGAKIDAQDNSGKTALIHAADHGLDSSFQALLAAGANAAIKDKTGKTALDYAKDFRRNEIIKLLNAK